MLRSRQGVLDGANRQGPEDGKECGFDARTQVTVSLQALGREDIELLDDVLELNDGGPLRLQGASPLSEINDRSHDRDAKERL